MGYGLRSMKFGHANLVTWDLWIFFNPWLRPRFISWCWFISRIFVLPALHCQHYWVGIPWQRMDYALWNIALCTFGHLGLSFSFFFFILGCSHLYFPIHESHCISSKIVLFLLLFHRDKGWKTKYNSCHSNNSTPWSVNQLGLAQLSTLVHFHRKTSWSVQ